MRRREFLKQGAIGLATGVVGGVAGPAPASGAGERQTPLPPVAPPRFEFADATIAALQEAMTSGRISARALTEQYLARIQAIDRSGPLLNSVIEINPEAVAIAEALDRERRATAARGVLHGIPILIKDNIDTADRMKTSAGSLALAESIAPRDAFIVERLRAAGVVILGKTNLSEWANFRSSRSTSGWSGRGGLTRNPYALDRNPCGSSSGSGVAAAANLCAAAIGTETDGSIVCPANASSLVGIKPTVGLVSRSGIIPISESQDTAGPLARSVADAAALLAAMTGVDARDAATARSKGHASADYTAFLDPDGLEGARLGVARKLFGENDHVERLFNEALDVMRELGAQIVDPAELPTQGKFGDAEHEVLLYEFKAGVNAYLAGLGSSAPVHTLSDLIEFNEQHRDREMPYFGQEIFEQAERKGALTSPAYIQARRTCRRLARTLGIDAVVARHRLDALIAPTGDPPFLTDLVNGDHFTGGDSSAMAAVAGYPHVTVPAGYLHGLPVGLSFIGAAWTEPTLIRLAYAFEQATKRRQSPRFLPTAEIKPVAPASSTQ
jgi:amidase